MFRYIALAWDPSVPAAAWMARSLSESLRARPDWHVERTGPGLCVFTTGTVERVNQAYRLGNGQGTLLGRVFPRHGDAASTQWPDALIDCADEVVASKGRALVDRYWGRYVAFFDSHDGGVCVLRDPSGALPCFLLHHEGVSVVFSWLEDVLTLLPQVPVPRVCRDGLGAHMAFGELSGHRTALEGVTQVLPGQCMQLNGAAPPSCSFAWRAAEMAHSPLERAPAEAATELRDTVIRCVEAWAGCYEAVLLRLSGGVDSSIVASCLAEDRTAARVTCLNYHSAGSDSDEREFARLAAAMAGRPLIEYERDPAVRLEGLLGRARTPAPFDYVGRLGSVSDAEVARRVGAPALFSGAGGDQLFFEVRQWWPAADYLRVRGFDRGFAAAALDAAHLGKVSVWKAVRYALGDRLRRRPPALDRHKHFTLLTAGVREQAARPEGFVHPMFHAPTTLPIGKLMQVQQLTHSSGYYNPITCERAPESVAPLLSQPLIELCLRLPTYLLTQGGRGRGLLRAAFEHAIPEAIAHRRSKGGIDDHVRAVLAHNLDFTKAMLLDGELVRLGLIDRVATESALCGPASGQTVHPSEIHVCLGIEAWLQQWTRQVRRAA